MLSILPVTGVTRLAPISVTSALHLAPKLDIIFRRTFLVVAENCGRVVKKLGIKGITKA